MKTIGDTFVCDDLKPSRRDVVKYGAAAAVSATVDPVGRLLAAEAPAASRASFMRTARAVFAARRAIRALPAFWCRTAVTSSGPMPPDAIRFRSRTRASFSSSSRPAMRVPVDEEMLPRFYYIHQPAGSPQSLNLRFRGIDPTGPLPDSVDFALRKADEPQKFDVIVFTDPQPESAVEVDFIRDDVVNALIGNATAAFGMTTGDIMFDDLSLYPRLNRIVGQIGLPWYNIGGNHDLNFEAPSAKYSRETFKRTYGPPYYAFEYGGALFLMLDNVNYLGFDPSKPRGGGKFEGRIGQRQLAFIANVLKEFPADKLVVTCMHIPLQNYLDPANPAMNTVDRGDFLKLHRGPSEYGQPVGTHPHHRASLFRRRGRLCRTDAAPSPCDDRGVGLVVERSLRSSRHCRRRQSRRQPERLSYSVDRRTKLFDPLSAGQRAEFAANAYHAQL